MSDRPDDEQLMKTGEAKIPAEQGATDKDAAASVTTAAASPRTPVQGILVGTLVELSMDGQALVSYPGNLAVLPVPARSTIPLSAEALGQEVALMFENGDINRPIVIGVMQQPAVAAYGDHRQQRPAQLENDDEPSTVALLEEPMNPADSELIIDGQRTQLQAREQIVLRCGKSSITMTRAGKIIIRGTYLSSKSSGANRIKGGSVQIN